MLRCWGAERVGSIENDRKIRIEHQLEWCAINRIEVAKRLLAIYDDNKMPRISMRSCEGKRWTVSFFSCVFPLTTPHSLVQRLETSLPRYDRKTEICKGRMCMWVRERWHAKWYLIWNSFSLLLLLFNIFARHRRYESVSESVWVLQLLHVPFSFVGNLKMVNAFSSLNCFCHAFVYGSADDEYARAEESLWNKQRQQKN